MMRFGVSLIRMAICALTAMTTCVWGQPDISLKTNEQVRRPVYVGRFDTVLQEPLKDCIGGNILRYQSRLRATQRVNMSFWDTNEVSAEEMWQLPQVRVSFVNIPAEILKENAPKQNAVNEDASLQESELIQCLDRFSITYDKWIDGEENAQPPIGLTEYGTMSPYQKGFRGICFLAADKERISAIRGQESFSQKPLVFGGRYVLSRVGGHSISPDNHYAKFRLPETMRPASLYTIDLDIGKIFEYEEVLRLEREKEARAKLTMGSVALSPPYSKKEGCVQYFDTTKKRRQSVDLIDPNEFLIPKDGRGSLLVFGPKRTGEPVWMVARDVPSNIDSMQFPRKQDLVVDPNRLIKFAVEIPDSHFVVKDPSSPWIVYDVGLSLDNSIESLHLPLVCGRAFAAVGRELSERHKTAWLSFVPGEYYLVIYPNFKGKSVLLMPISLTPKDKDKVFRISEMRDIKSFSKPEWQKMMEDDRE